MSANGTINFDDPSYNFAPRPEEPNYGRIIRSQTPTFAPVSPEVLATISGAPPAPPMNGPMTPPLSGMSDYATQELEASAPYLEALPGYRFVPPPPGLPTPEPEDRAARRYNDNNYWEPAWGYNRRDFSSDDGGCYANNDAAGVPDHDKWDDDGTDDDANDDAGVTYTNNWVDADGYAVDDDDVPAPIHWDDAGYYADDEDDDDEPPLSPEDHRRSVLELMEDMLDDLDFMIRSAEPTPSPYLEWVDQTIADNYNNAIISGQDDEVDAKDNYNNNSSGDGGDGGDGGDEGEVDGEDEEDPEGNNGDQPIDTWGESDSEEDDDDPSDDDDSGSEEQQQQQPDGPWLPIRQPRPAEHSLFGFQCRHEAYLPPASPILAGQRLQPPIQRPAPVLELEPDEEARWNHILEHDEPAPAPAPQRPALRRGQALTRGQGVLSTRPRFVLGPSANVHDADEGVRRFLQEIWRQPLYNEAAQGPCLMFSQLPGW
ncbi:hypothetical protein PG997_011911 [Apiospora hydei]|uniref:Uncharacterized protein n=1 Tax=Apiospora hydei TaxID=1337664 RepID=A0ABR1V541_9PEZI